MVNLLVNGGFEGQAWRATHSGQAIPEIESPEGWVTFWREDAGYKRPECKVISPQNPLWPQWQDPRRYHAGVQSWQCFTAFGKMWAGLYQTVSGLMPGARYRLRAFAHAWSYHPGIDPRATSPNCSVGVGCGPVAIPCAAIPPLNGDPLNDAIGNFRFSVGVSNGAVADPFQADYSACAAIYNAFAPVELEFTAESATVTVYLLASSLWNFQNSDAYWDTVTLERMESTPEPPGECRGRPRVQYERTYLLLHASEPPEMWRGALDALLALGVRWTIGPSADDAGIGDLERRRVVAVNPALWGDALEAFFEAHYAGVVYVPVLATTPADLFVELRRLIEGDVPVAVFSQRDPRWAFERMGASTALVGLSGCAMVSACMVASQVEPGLTPLELNRRLSTNGGYTSAGLLYWRKVADAVPGLRFTSYATWRTVPKPDADMALVRAAIARGPCVIQVDYQPGDALDTHFVVATRMLPGEDIEIVDPWAGDVTTLRTRYWNGSLAQSIYALAEYAVDGVAPPLPPAGNLPASRMLGLHLQDWGDKAAVLEFCRRVQPGVMKIFDAGMAPEIRVVAPNAVIVYRQHIDRAMELECLQNPVPMASWFLDQFAEQVRPYVERGEITHIETAINETMDGDRVAAAVAFELAFIAELKRRLPKARPVVATIAVGNPHESQYPLLLPLAVEIARVGGAFGYHAYWPVETGFSYLQSDWPWHAGRFEGMDAYFRQFGFAVDWVLSECGPCGGIMEGNEAGRWFAYDPAAGWRSPLAFGGNWERTLEDINEFRRRLAASTARVLGATWFTVCPWDWQYFHLDGAQIRTL